MCYLPALKMHWAFSAFALGYDIGNIAHASGKGCIDDVMLNVMLMHEPFINIAYMTAVTFSGCNIIVLYLPVLQIVKCRVKCNFKLQFISLVYTKFRVGNKDRYRQLLGCYSEFCKL